MSEHIVFVTTEFEPATAGGAGAVVAGIADHLVDVGWRVSVLLLSADPIACDDARVKVVSVDPREIAADGRPLAASKTAARALVEHLNEDPAFAVEFQDFDGLGFWALTHRTGTALATTRIGIRYHLPADHILDAIGIARADFSQTRILERQALACADFVISQTDSMQSTITQRYGVPSERIIVGPPPVPAVRRSVRDISHSPKFAVIGRLSEQKGVHDLLSDMGPMLADHPDMTIEFIGSDGWSATHDRAMRAWLLESVDAGIRRQIMFTDPMDREILPSYLSDVWAVIVPSRLESFCLVAHEVRAMGVPLIVRNEPAIIEHFSHGRGAIVYDRADAGFVTALSAVLDDPSVLDRTSGEGESTVTDPVAVYSDLPNPRHAQSQAGLATAALHNLKAESTDRDAPHRGMAAIAGALLRRLPDPVARAAVVVAPKSLKDRFRSFASWPAEQEKRMYDMRLAAMQSAIASGAFTPVPDPLVSVIIPCYNQGHLIEAAILSVFEQSHDSWEIVIVNDGSTDGVTTDTLASIDLPRVRVIDQENQGLPGARNTGIRASQGRFFVPLDADDELLPSYIESMIEAIDDDASLAFVHCWAELFGDVNWIWATRPYNPFTELLSNGVLQTAMVRRAAWDEVGGYDETLTSGNEDWDMWLRLQEAGWTNHQIRQPLYRYRKEGISMSVTNEAAFEEGRQRMVDRHPNLYTRRTLTALKRGHYPLLSVVLADAVLPTGLDLDDVEIVGEPAVLLQLESGIREHGWTSVPATGDACDAALCARGKYLIFMEGGTPGPGPVGELVDHLERHDREASRTGDDGVTVTRRWALVDRGAELDGDVPRTFDSCQDPDLFVPSSFTVDGRTLSVVRQVPDEEGRLPAWVTDE